MDIKIDEEVMKSVVSAAILNSLDQGKRDTLVQGAIKHLLTPVKTDSRWSSDTRSPIQEAFEYAIRNAAIRIVGEMLQNDKTVEDQIKGLVVEAMTRLAETNREKTVEKLADAIAKGMAYRERD